jgi:hypothetical protein
MVVLAPAIGGLRRGVCSGFVNFVGLSVSCLFFRDPQGLQPQYRLRSLCLDRSGLLRVDLSQSFASAEPAILAEGHQGGFAWDSRCLRGHEEKQEREHAPDAT